ncbi:calcium-binding protein [Acidisphaera sp. L21]|uniref:calcium-binding protein n=1 Tax=Acidisphaera sp. L21 TaxID=1641851 RepID=UPI00131EB46F|nr:calcium-binding protein [Acidisphaera sp. L21]
MRLFAAAAAAVLLVGATAQAQSPMTGTTAPIASPAAPVVTPPAAASKVAPATPTRRGRSLQDRFDEANVTHDGHLTMEQARAKMPSVARDFAQIDTAKAGYVTVDQIREHSRAMRAQRRAAKKAATATTPAKAQ